MAVTIILLLAVLAIMPAQTQDPQIDMTMVQQMQQREEFLQQEVMRLLQEIEWIRSPQEAPLLSGLQICLFWAAAATMLVEVCWLAWQMKLAPCSCCVQDSSGNKEENDNEDEKLKGACQRVRLLSVPNLLSVQELSDTCRNVKKMMHDVLRVCRVLSKDTFMPDMHPVTGKNGIHESWTIFEEQLLYQLLVFLQPPPGHFFKLELYGGTHLPERCSNIRVVLECTCLRKMGNIPCFIHPSKTSETGQHSPLLQNLCTGSYLDVEEITCWVQNLVQTAWEHLPQWQDWQLTVLPSSHSCRLLLNGPSELQLCAVLVFAVEQGSPGTFLVLQ
ncbi:inositol 1,4,5-trisphosphate receptor-interacting protein-like 1 [Passer domesticus]|uniref:inositol 1,4,5-trisphosphate receptor-interacting protein-like 1 n=1 Tax=Passer domesticus TaxID=48849 RepID=UPI0030FE1F60